METFDCPKCGKENEIEWETLPGKACDSDLIYCDHCDTGLQVGWDAVLRVELDSQPTGQQ